MLLNQNSISAKLYRWYYNTNSMPQNLCPYFWQLVIMWVTILPLTLFSLPFQLGTKFDKASWDERLSTSFIFYLLLILLFGVVLYSIKLISQLTALELIMIGVMVCGFGIGILIAKYFRKDYSKPKEPSVIIEFAKASYNKYCPKIDWK